MADTIRQVDYYSMEVPNRPGEGSRIFSAIKGADLNLLATCGFPIEGGKKQVDFVPEDPEAFRKTAPGLGLKLSRPKLAFLIQGEDRVGAAADTFDRLGREGINIIAAQALAAGAGRWGMILWVNPADQPRAAEVLEA
jgi:hypothetical protein